MFERLAPLNPVAHNHICDGLFRLVSELSYFFLRCIAALLLFIVHSSSMYHLSSTAALATNL